MTKQITTIVRGRIGTDDQCLAVPPSSATHLCPAVPPTCAAQQCPSVPPVSAAYQCPSLLHSSASSSVLPIS
ncbi:unnamed protein product, partial [Staurois parvus]